MISTTKDFSCVSPFLEPCSSFSWNVFCLHLCHPWACTSQISLEERTWGSLWRSPLWESAWPSNQGLPGLLSADAWWNCPDLLCLAFQPAWDSLRAHCNFQLFLSAPRCTPSSSTGVVTESISRASLYLLLSPFPQSFTGTLPNKYHPPPCNFLLMLLIRVTHNLN